MSEMLMDEDRIVTVRNVKDEFGITHETAQIILTEEWIWKKEMSETLLSKIHFTVCQRSLPLICN